MHMNFTARWPKLKLGWCFYYQLWFSWTYNLALTNKLSWKFCIYLEKVNIYIHSDKLDLKTESPTEINPLFYCLLMRVNQTKNGGFDSKTEKIKDSTPAYLLCFLMCFYLFKKTIMEVPVLSVLYTLIITFKSAHSWSFLHCAL